MGFDAGRFLFFCHPRRIVLVPFRSFVAPRSLYLGSLALSTPRLHHTHLCVCCRALNYDSVKFYHFSRLSPLSSSLCSSILPSLSGFYSPSLLALFVERMYIHALACHRQSQGNRTAKFSPSFPFACLSLKLPTLISISLRALSGFRNRSFSFSRSFLAFWTHQAFTGSALYIDNSDRENSLFRWRTSLRWTGTLIFFELVMCLRDSDLSSHMLNLPSDR